MLTELGSSARLIATGGVEGFNYGAKSIFENPASLSRVYRRSLSAFTTELMDEVTYLNVNTDGILDIDELKGIIKDSTIMVAVLHANNEIGVIQPIEEIAKICKGSEIAFFVDAAQSFGKIQLDVKKVGIDLLCASGHKIYGPKGIGCLYIDRDKFDIYILKEIGKSEM